MAAVVLERDSYRSGIAHLSGLKEVRIGMEALSNFAALSNFKPGRSLFRMGKRVTVDLNAESKKVPRGLGEQVLRTLIVNVGINDGALETSPAEWHADPRLLASAHEAIGIDTGRLRRTLSHPGRR